MGCAVLKHSSGKALAFSNHSGPCPGSGCIIYRQRRYPLKTHVYSTVDNVCLVYRCYQQQAAATVAGRLFALHQHCVINHTTTSAVTSTPVRSTAGHRWSCVFQVLVHDRSHSGVRQQTNETVVHCTDTLSAAQMSPLPCGILGGSNGTGRRAGGTRPTAPARGLIPLLASDTCGPLVPGHTHSQYRVQGPHSGRGVSWSQVQSSGTVYQPSCDLQLSPRRRLLKDI